MRDLRDAVTPALSVADRDLERVLCGEAPAELVARVEALAREDPALAAHLAERRAAQAAFALLHPRLPELPAAPASSRWSRWTASIARMWRAGALGGAVAAACVLAFVVVDRK